MWTRLDDAQVIYGMKNCHGPVTVLDPDIEC